MASTEPSATTSHSNGPTFSLESILRNDHDKLEHPNVKPESWDEEDTEREVAHGYCVECEDQPAEVHCETCDDEYASQHSIEKAAGKRHPAKSLENGEKMPSKPAKNGVDNGKPNGGCGDRGWRIRRRSRGYSIIRANIRHRAQLATCLGFRLRGGFVERAKYILLRLTLGERKYLRLLDAALQVSEYTDKIDTLGFGMSKAKRIVHQIRELCAILSGLVLAADYKHGQELFTDRDFASNSDFYQKVFELGRRDTKS